jgi:hypothetical protein
MKLLQHITKAVIRTLIGVSLVINFLAPVAILGSCSSWSMRTPPIGILTANDLLMIPFSLIISFSGIPFLLTVLLEAFILSKRENISYLKSCLLTGFANVIYLVMMGLSTVFGSESFFPINLVWATIFAVLFIKFYQRTGYLKNINKGVFNFLVYLFFIGLGFAKFFLTASLNVSTSIPNAYAATAGIIAIGFIMGFVIKGFAVDKFMKVKSPYFANTIMSMHVASYPIVAGIFYLIKTLNVDEF